MGVQRKIQLLGVGSFTKNRYRGGTWTVCWFRGGVFLRGWGLIPQCTLWLTFSCIILGAVFEVGGWLIPQCTLWLTFSCIQLGGVFEGWGVVDTPMHTILTFLCIIHERVKESKNSISLLISVSTRCMIFLTLSWPSKHLIINTENKPMGWHIPNTVP